MTESLSIPSKLWFSLEDRVSITPDIRYSNTAMGYDQLPVNRKHPDVEVPHPPLKPAEVSKKHKGLGGQRLQNNTACHEYLALDVQKVKQSHLLDLAKHKTNRRTFVNERYEEAEHGFFPGTFIIPNIGLYPSLWLSILFILPIKGLVIFMPIILGGTLLLNFFLDGVIPTLRLLFFLEDEFLWPIWGYIALYPLDKLLDKAQKMDFHRIFDPKKTPMFCAIKRDTGMIRLFNNNKEWADLPFREFGGFNTMIPTGRGSQTRKLSMVHRPTGVGLLVGEGGVDGWHPALLWEFYQHFMDVSRPLPDVPEFEPYRHLDPTTREWDKTHNRPSRYWRDMDSETYKQMVDEAITAAKAYPFLEPETAETQQWAPSGQGKHWYQLG
ncbi:hypothetical protein [Reinekea blandensis]|uniref:Transmembrane protein n=1 Tax=Reinekea blandensis MED297 TaxID=314283 RepID=A4BCX8_9GAMM|nr:hypothetical protein [Reinekea blandensis]EAR10060.1 hypothetical protein MED297_08226 [Reinekea sp. MED297] [Reinekea blandensis MED297]